MSDRRIGAALFGFLACVYLATAGLHPYTGDGLEMLLTGESLILRGDLAVVYEEGGRHWGYPGPDGRRYSPYALGLSVIEAPLYGAGKALASALPLQPIQREQIAQAAALSANAFITAATGLLLFLLARAIGYGAGASVAAAILHGLGTMAWVYSKHDFAEPLAALCLVGAAAFLERSGPEGRARALVAAGAFNGYGFFSKYQMVLYSPVLIAQLLWIARAARASRSDLARRAALFLVPGLGFGIANLLVNHARFGTWLQTGYANQGEIVAGASFVPIGLFGLLLGSGKGIFWYSPILLAAPFAWRVFHRRAPRASAVSLGMISTTLAIFSPLWWWHGDWSWGPRYLLVALPFAALPLAGYFEIPEWLRARFLWKVRASHILAVLMALSLLVNLLGLSVNFVYYLIELREMEKVHDDWNFVPALSPLRFHAHVLASEMDRLLGRQPEDFVYRSWCDGVFQERRITMVSYPEGGRTPDFFFFRPRDTLAERAGLLLLGLGLLGGAFVCGASLRRAVSPTRGIRAAI